MKSLTITLIALFVITGSITKAQTATKPKAQTGTKPKAQTGTKPKTQTAATKPDAQNHTTKTKRIKTYSESKPQKTTAKTKSAPPVETQNAQTEAQNAKIAEQKTTIEAQNDIIKAQNAAIKSQEATLSAKNDSIKTQKEQNAAMQAQNAINLQNAQTAAAKSQETDEASKPQKTTSAWIVGLGFNVVDDDGHKLRKLFDVQNSWNFVYFPSRLSIERTMQQGFSVEAAATYNQLKAGKIINGAINKKTSNYVALDVSAKYNLQCFFDCSKFWIRPFILAGYGYTDRGIPTVHYYDSRVATTTGSFTQNLGLGFNVWMNKDFAFSFQSMAKFVGKTSSNQMQHSITVIYKLGNKKNGTEKKKDPKKKKRSRSSKHVPVDL